MSKSRFVLKPAKVGGSGASDLTRYVAKKDLDRRREGERARPLFDEARDDLTFWEARKHLSITGGTLPREDVMHYVLSFEVLKDYNLLGDSDEERAAQIRAYLRSGLAKAAKEMGIERWRWAAGIHLNKPHPHVHLLINKTVVDRRTGELSRVEKLLKPVVAHNKDGEGKTREFDYGTIINSFAADVNARLRERAHERTPNDRDGRQLGEAKAQRERLSDRILLGESMWARHLVGRLERETEALKTHGDKRRFRLFDPTHDRVRHVSAHDIRRRATAEAQRSVAGVKFSSPAERDRTRQQFFDDNLARHQETLAEHQEKVEGHLARLEARLDQARQNHQLLQPHVENVRARYKEKNEPLPLPVLSREQTGKLQDEAVEARDAPRIRTMEKIRQSLSIEHSSPARTPHERGRLAAQLREAEIELHARHERERQFEHGFHLTRWEIGGNHLSLASVDARLEKARVQTSFIHVGVAAWIPSWRRESESELARLQGVRQQVEDRVRERQKELAEERERAAETVRALEEIRESDARALVGRGDERQIEPAAPVYTRAELNRMESHAHTTRDARLLMEVHEARQEKYMRLPAEKRPSVQNLAAEAEARAFVAGLDFEAAQKVRAEEARWGRFTPVAARTGDGSLITGSLRQTEVLSRADAIIRMVEDRPERREQARSIISAAAIRAAETEAAYDRAADYLAASRMIADEYREEMKEVGRNAPRPSFSPKDLSRIDLYRAQSNQPEERSQLQLLLDRSELGALPARAGRERDFPALNDDHLHTTREQKTHVVEPPVHTR